MKGEVLRRLYQVVLPDAESVSDGQLLGRYVARREEAAFAALLRRHGPMVLGVCRRVLRDGHDAEDAFQATFLVLAQKASAVRPPEQVGNWLYGVAYRTALKARATNARRRAGEQRLRERPGPDAPEEDWRELQPLLDEELNRLPDRYRTAVVLCDLEGKTHREAARQLGWPAGTLSARLAAARKRLARGLARHGLALAPGSLAWGLSHSTTAAAIPAALTVSTARAAGLIAAGQPAAAAASATVVALMERGVNAMVLARVKLALVLALTATGGLAAGLLVARGPEDKGAREKPVVEGKKEEREVYGIVQAVDAGRGTITVAVKGEADRTLAVTRGALVTLDGRKEGKLTDLPAGTYVLLRLSAGREVTAVWAHGPVGYGRVKAVDPDKGTLTVAEKTGERTCAVGQDAQIILDEGKTARLADVPRGSVVSVRLSVDQKTAVEIRAEGPTTPGVLKAVDAGKGLLTLTVKGEGDRTYAVGKKADVVMDDKKAGLADLPVAALVTIRQSADGKTVVAVRAEGPVVQGVLKGRPENDAVTLSTKLGDETYRVAREAEVLIEDVRRARLADLIDGTIVALALSADRTAARSVRAEGPSFSGVVKEVDVKGKTITLTVEPKSGEDRTFSLTGETRVVTALYGAARQLTDLKQGQEVVLRLSLDQKAAGRITLQGE